jgi:ubiquinone/menaquinone biosynthesis C-methylase UbiE
MKDYFSLRSKAYAIYRPRYPKELFEFIAGLAEIKKTAWDAGTGNGQTATELALLFDQVIATDISPQQLEQAPRVVNIRYQSEPAEKTSIAGASVNLVTVSQALHWFKLDSFYEEVRRVAASRAIIAAWTYSLLMIDPEVDELLKNFHFNILKHYWDPERKHVDNGYRDIPFPFKSVDAPGFQITTQWRLEDLEGYLNTWSAVQKFIANDKINPVTALMEEISLLWEKEEVKEINFPIHLKLGFIQ